MKWPRRHADNPVSGLYVIGYALITPVIVFIVGYIACLGMVAITFGPSKPFDPLEMAIFMTMACTFFFWLLAFAMYYGPGEAALREERRQKIRDSIKTYMARYPDAKPVTEEFAE